MPILLHCTEQCHPRFLPCVFFFRSKAIISYFSRINCHSQIIGPLKIQRGLNAAGDYSKGSVCLRGTKIVNL